MAVELGKLISDYAIKVNRDAVHVAVFPAFAGKTLSPGQRVYLIGDYAYPEDDGNNNSPIGIVDPFLTGEVQENRQFWLFMFPNTVGDLRHSWSHPLIEDEEVSVYDGCAGC